LPAGGRPLAASNTCPSCGAINNASNLFCIHCGRPLTAPGMPLSPTPYPYPTPTAPGYPLGQPPGAPPPTAVYPYFGPPPRRATFSSILSGMFDVWTKGFKEFFLVFLIAGLVNGVIGALFTYAIFQTVELDPALPFGVPPVGVSTANWGDILLVLFFVTVAGIIVKSIVAGGIIEYAVQRFRGEMIPLVPALRRGFGKFPSILGAKMPLDLLAFTVVYLPLLLIVSFAQPIAPVDPGSALALICGAAAIFVFGGLAVLYIIIAMSLYAPAIMMENASALGGLARSWRITKGHWWSLFAVVLVAAILGAIIVLAIVVPVVFLGNAAVRIAAAAVAVGIIGAWEFVVPAVAYDLILREPTLFPRPYYPWPGPATPPGAGPPPQPPAAPPAPPAGP
jgi:hypothetical protein